MQTYTLTLNPSAQPGQLHLTLEAETSVVTGIVQQFLSADPLPVSPPAGRPHQSSTKKVVKHGGHRLVEGVCQFCSNRFQGRSGQKFCSAAHARRWQLLGRKTQANGAAEAEATG